MVFSVEAFRGLEWDLVSLEPTRIVCQTSPSISSYGETVQVWIEGAFIRFISECTGVQRIDWGKNKRNFDAYLLGIDTARSNYPTDKIPEGYARILENPPKAPQAKKPESVKEKAVGTLKLFFPKKGYLITPLLIDINILILVVMGLSGVNILMPNSEHMIAWGANFKPETLNGGLWRLFTSTFLHFGIVHLAMNLYALMYIGLLLEPIISSPYFLFAYLLAGITSSITSLVWHDTVLSAGASGAIFGMYGLFLVLLATRVIDKARQKGLLSSILMFVVYNLVFGMAGNIDNAAHIGGLAGGAIIGFAMMPSLRRNDRRSGNIAMGAITITLLLVVFKIAATLPNYYGDYKKEMTLFGLVEQKGVAFYALPPTTGTDTLIQKAQEGLNSWKQALEIIKRVDQIKYPSKLAFGYHTQNAKLITYCELRIATYEAILKGLTEDCAKCKIEVQAYHLKIKNILDDLEK